MYLKSKMAGVLLVLLLSAPILYAADESKPKAIQGQTRAELSPTDKQIGKDVSQVAKMGYRFDKMDENKKKAVYLAMGISLVGGICLGYLLIKYFP